ncbi:hypothetical protein UCREL1_2711 [Eutypa lata UCREL1]|uniref:Uncharacterized protein n=1 Tax=Eutypa lata (strain UCR-EL1) TaxID=1287681 RepID=M7SUM0_EUTLA|nr:hypothetical protein UCREL1_2711 [Eutypa lata UCREL1]
MSTEASQPVSPSSTGVFYFASPDDEESDDDESNDDESNDDYQEALQVELLKGICFPSLGDGEIPFREPLLGYKISSFTPLLLVSKQVSREVQHISRAINADWHALIKRSIRRARFVRPVSPRFLDLCARSRFDIGLESEEAMHFLGKIPSAVRQQIRSLVITSSNLFCDDAGNREAWSPTPMPYTELLRRKFTALREIAIFLPEPGSHEVDFYAGYAPHAIGELLQDGVVDVVRFLEDPYGWALGDNDSDDRRFDATIEELLDAETGKPLKQTCESPFNVWPEAKTVIALRRRDV